MCQNGSQNATGSLFIENEGFTEEYETHREKHTKIAKQTDRSTVDRHKGNRAVGRLTFTPRVLFM